MRSTLSARKNKLTKFVKIFSGIIAGRETDRNKFLPNRILFGGTGSCPSTMHGGTEIQRSQSNEDAIRTKCDWSPMAIWRCYSCLDRIERIIDFENSTIFFFQRDFIFSRIMFEFVLSRRGRKKLLVLPSIFLSVSQRVGEGELLWDPTIPVHSGTRGVHKENL